MIFRLLRQGLSLVKNVKVSVLSILLFSALHWLSMNGQTINNHYLTSGPFNTGALVIAVDVFLISSINIHVSNIPVLGDFFHSLISDTHIHACVYLTDWPLSLLGSSTRSPGFIPPQATHGFCPHFWVSRANFEENKALLLVRRARLLWVQLFPAVNQFARSEALHRAVGRWAGADSVRAGPASSARKSNTPGGEPRRWRVEWRLAPPILTPNSVSFSTTLLQGSITSKVATGPLHLHGQGWCELRDMNCSVLGYSSCNSWQ